jgi:hypothetical protein
MGDVHVGGIAWQAVHSERTSFNFGQNTRIDQRSRRDTGKDGWFLLISSSVSQYSESGLGMVFQSRN